jgi:hypothetical protein
MNAVTVVHLVRRANSPELLRRFVDSYLRFDPGVSHDVHVICKGFESCAVVEAEFDRVGRACEFRLVSDEGVDVGAYFAHAAFVRTEFACFMNSHCEVTSEGWLRKLLAAALRRGVGVAGATASFESTLSLVVDQTRTQWRSLVRSPSVLRERAALLWNTASMFPRYPNPHVRTNVFMIRPPLLRQLSLPRNDRQSALAFESGRRSMTRQLSSRGLQALVAGADGQVYEAGRWPESHTFRSGEQRNLLVHDNQTRRYRDGDAAERQYLGRLAWGRRYLADQGKAALAPQQSNR